MQADNNGSDEFFELFNLPPQIADHPIRVLKDTLALNYRKPGTRKNNSRTYFLALIIKAWNAFCEKRTVKLLRFQVGENLPIMIGYTYADKTNPEDASDDFGKNYRNVSVKDQK